MLTVMWTVSLVAGLGRSSAGSRYGEPTSSASSYRSPLSREDSGGLGGGTGGYRSQRTSRDETLDSPTSRYGTSSSSTGAASASSTPSYTSRFLNKSKSSAAVDDDESTRKAAAVPDESTRYVMLT